MESGKKAVVIIIIAMMLTAGVGVLFNFEKKEITRTEYYPIGNMDALISANSERTQESELYNSVYNVTGWQPNTGVERLPAGQTNTYILKEASTQDIPTSYTFNFAERGITTSTYTEYNTSGDDTRNYRNAGASNTLYTFLTSNGSVTYHPTDSSAPVLSSGKPLIGGYGQKEYERFYWGNSPQGAFRYLTSFLQYEFNGNTVSYSETNPAYIVFVSLSELIDMSNVITEENRNDIFKLTFNTAGLSYYAGTSIVVDCPAVRQYSGDWSGTQGTDTINVKITPTSEKTFTYMRYNVATQNWTLFLNGANQGTINPNEFYIICTNSSIPGISTTLTRTVYVPPTYADPTKYVSLSASSTWSNHYVVKSDEIVETTFINTGVDMLVKGAGTFRICDKDGNWTDNITITRVDGVYSVNGVKVGIYLGLRLSMSSLDNTLIAEGIITDESGTGTSDTPTYNYTLSGYRVTIPLPDEFTIPNMYRIQFTPANGTTMQTYIENTYILSDPNQVLWSNIDIDLRDYYPENITKFRLLLQGFARYGDKIYLNGDEDGYTVIDGKFSIIQGEGNNTTATTFTLNGTAIDFYGGHTYVVQTNGNARVDLGQTQSTAIRMTGVWYFSTTASEISVFQDYGPVWSPGWSLSMDATILLFVGVIFMSLVIMGMRYRDEMEILDVIVLILTMVIAMSLLVIT